MVREKKNAMGYTFGEKKMFYVKNMMVLGVLTEIFLKRPIILKFLGYFTFKNTFFWVNFVQIL